MNPDVLKELRDIHLPESVSWWPPAIGWWLLLAALIVILLGVYFGIQRKKASSLKNSRSWKAVLQEAQQLWQQLYDDAKQNPENNSPLEAECVALIRRVARQHPNADASIASLIGSDWLSWLDEQWDENSFNTELGTYFSQRVYQPSQPLAKDKSTALFEVCGRWLEAQKQWQT